MINISQLDKAYGAQVLFQEAQLQMSPGERLGLVGRNGHGKSTLFKMILGELDPDGGQIITPRDYQIGHLAQHLHFTEPTLLEEACLGLREEDQYDHYKAERILFGLGFVAEDMDRAPSEFSGGFQIRLNLAKVLVSEPNLLLLDEPTNYLDIISLRWLVSFLQAWPNELMIISHDRSFMDQVTTHTALIHRQTIRKVKGPTHKIYELIAQEEETYEKTRLNQERQRKHAEAFVNRFRAKANKASMVQSRVKMLEKLPQLSKLSSIEQLGFKFRYEEFKAKTLLECREVRFGYEPGQALIDHLFFNLKATDRVGIIGKNGQGKSTLLRLIAGELQPNQGNIERHDKMQLGYFGQTNIDRLTTTATVEDEIWSANADLSRTQVRGLCGLMMFSGDLAEKKIAQLSGGEKSRVMLGKILATPANLLLLDEPSNHLDMESVEALIDSINEFPGAVITVTHNEDILRKVVDTLIIFHQGRVDVFNGTYDEFLDKVGWDNEDYGRQMQQIGSSQVATESTEPARPTLTKKERRQQRSQLVEKRSQELGPLKKTITSLEDAIHTLEQEQERCNAALLQASQEQDVNAFVNLSKDLKEIEKAIEQKFKDFEKKSALYEQGEKKFQALLDELE